LVHGALAKGSVQRFVGTEPQQISDQHASDHLVSDQYRSSGEGRFDT
jgi:hypothetical protein